MNDLQFQVKELLVDVVDDAFPGDEFDAIVDQVIGLVQQDVAKQLSTEVECRDIKIARQAKELESLRAEVDVLERLQDKLLDQIVEAARYNE